MGHGVLPTETGKEGHGDEHGVLQQAARLDAGQVRVDDLSKRTVCAAEARRMPIRWVIQADAPFDLGLLDHTVPGVNGLGRLRVAMGHRGGQSVALMSGEAGLS